METNSSETGLGPKGIVEEIFQGSEATKLG